VQPSPERVKFFYDTNYYANIPLGGIATPRHHRIGRRIGIEQSCRTWRRA
jgi:hypothetical protein